MTSSFKKVMDGIKHLFRNSVQPYLQKSTFQKCIQRSTTMKPGPLPRLTLTDQLNKGQQRMIQRRTQMRNKVIEIKSNSIQNLLCKSTDNGHQSTHAINSTTYTKKMSMIIRHGRLYIKVRGFINEPPDLNVKPPMSYDH